MQLERAERIDKVEQTVGEVVGDYERLLRAMEEKRPQSKRKVALVEEDGDDDNEDTKGEEQEREPKRRKGMKE